MKVVGAIDVGSNAIRMSCVRFTDDRRLEMLETSRSSVRLGEDVYGDGHISDEKANQLLDTFKIYKRVFDQNNATEVRAYATAAIREARNGMEVRDRVREETGISLEVISGGKEASLLQRAIRTEIDTQLGAHMMADLGGGSVEITIIGEGEIQFAESFRMGTVRLLKMFYYDAKREDRFVKSVTSYLEDFARQLPKDLRRHFPRVENLILTGGNAVALGKLGLDLGKKSRQKGKVIYLGKDDLHTIRKELLSRSYQDRMDAFGMRNDRADVIIPALLVYETLLKGTNCQKLTIPDVGLREGILDELLTEHSDSEKLTEHEQIIRSAFHYLKKYHAHVGHARQVQKFCAQLFDSTKPLHGLTDRERVILEVAGILHDVGRFVRPSDHHKHSMYLIGNMELVGLTNTERDMAALLALYHAKGTPSDDQEAYRNLNKQDRAAVLQLTALIRIADACDREHDARIESLDVRVDKDAVNIDPHGDEDLMLTTWSLGNKKALFEKTFGRKLLLQPATPAPPPSAEK
jgi:exopolyphosphatase/guanosine-5'-triphosphate,3'-diphosphate pyrophosphatase